MLVKLAAFIEPGTRRRWLLLAVLALVGSAFEAGGALLTVVLLAAITGGGRLRLPWVGDMHGLLVGVRGLSLFIAFSLLFFIFRGMFVVLQTYLQHRIAGNAGVRLSARLQRSYLHMPYDLYVQRNSAELIRTTQGSVESVVRHALIPGLTLCADVGLVVAITAVLVVVQPAATLGAAVGLALVVVPVQRAVRPRLHQLGRMSEATAKAALQSLQQSLQGAREVRLSGNSRQFQDEYLRHRSSFTRAYYTQATFEAVPRIVIETGFIVIVLLLLLAAVLRGGDLAAALSVLGLFAYAVLRVLPALNRIISAVNNIKYGTAAIDNVYADLIAVERCLPLSCADALGDRRIAFVRDLRIDRVSYRYPETQQDVLCGITFDVTRGESVGIVGPTGSGKSTIVDIVLGLLTPADGRVLVDGRDVRDDLEAWHASIGVVPQSVFLLDDTLRRNIAFGVADRAISEERILEAVRAARLHAWVKALPDGLETLVGERGVRMSGGQRQRVAIARALYRQPDLLVLDEGTSALDNRTEAEIIRALADLRGSVTMLIVAHRLSTVRDCDRIVLVEAGRILDAAPFDVLLERHESFRRMAR